MSGQTLHPSRRARRGMTITEGVIGMAILATAIAAGMQGVAQSASSNRHAEEWRVGRSLIDAATATLDALPYEDPTVASTALGSESGEGSGPLAWDDIDDANGWSGVPAAASAPSGWSVRIAVAFASASNPKNDAATESGLKRITISAERDGRAILAVVLVRGRHG